MARSTQADGTRDAAEPGGGTPLSDAYARYAEAAERTVGTFQASANRIRADLRAVAGGARESAQHLSDTGTVAARTMRDRSLGLSERGFTYVERQAAQGRTGLQAVVREMVHAFDANVRAGFDFAERLAGAGDARDVLAAQAAYVEGQARRSVRQMIDLQRAAAELLHGSVRVPLK